MPIGLTPTDLETLMNLDPSMAALIFVVCGGYVAYHFYREWGASGQYVDAMNAREDLTQSDFAAIRGDARLLQLLGRLGTQFRITEDPSDATGHRLVYARFAGARGETILVPNAADAPWLFAYLKGANGLQVALNLATQEISESAIGFTSVGQVLPMWARR